MVWKKQGGIMPAKMPSAIGMGLAISLGVTIATAGVVAFLIAGEKISENAAGYGAAVALLLGAVLGALAAAWRCGERRMVMCLISGGVYFLSLLCCTALFFDGMYQGVGTTALMVFGGSIAAGLMGMKGKRNPKLKKLRIR